MWRPPQFPDCGDVGRLDGVEGLLGFLKGGLGGLQLLLGNTAFNLDKEKDDRLDSRSIV